MDVQCLASKYIAHVGHASIPPIAGKAWQARFAGQKLLHCGLLEVALLGDEPVQPAQKCIHIAQRRRDGALFREWWEVDFHAIEPVCGHALRSMSGFRRYAEKHRLMGREPPEQILTINVISKDERLD